MKPGSKLWSCAALASLAGLAAAENYVAQIYSNPPGSTSMMAVGAGDNALMGGQATIGGQIRAFYRTAAGSKDMHPTGWFSSLINDSWGSTYHCGTGKQTSGGGSQALFWIGGGTAVPLHPAGAGYMESGAEGGGGQVQVGWVSGSFACAQCGITATQHAGMWSRTAASFSRLHAANHIHTYAYGTDGVKQVGRGTSIDNDLHALLWNGPNSFAVNLHPASGYGMSVARSVWGSQQGGSAQSNADFNWKACMWSGTAASFVDLNPTPFGASEVRAVRNGLQAGCGNPNSNPTKLQAIAWHGNAATWINLHSRLPYPFTLWSSSAEGIDNLGNVIGYVWNQSTGEKRPVVWKRI